jgi:uncharacterized membrane protein YraQ (UPF0718 family)
VRRHNERSKSAVRPWVLLGVILAAAVVLVITFPGRGQATRAASGRFLVEMAAVLPAAMILMGLFAVWVSNDTVTKYLGQASGVKGIAFALLLGAMPSGPLYVAFPMAAALLKKGARVSNVVVLLSAWACISIPQELVELQFLGAKFMAARLVLTISAVVAMGLVIERLGARRQTS